MSRFVYRDLVQISKADGFNIDLKYASSDNFTGRMHYEIPICLIHRDILQPLKRAGERLKKDGFFIKIWDAYRPLSIQKSLYEATPDHLKAYVPAPSGDAPHPKGCTVDITLVDGMGNELAMPTAFDDFSERAHARYGGLLPEQKKNRDYLIEVMKDNGFTVSALEWWHFDFNGWRAYPSLDISLSMFAEEEQMMLEKEEGGR